MNQYLAVGHLDFEGFEAPVAMNLTAPITKIKAPTVQRTGHDYTLIFRSLHRTAGVRTEGAVSEELSF